MHETPDIDALADALADSPESPRRRRLLKTATVGGLALGLASAPALAQTAAAKAATPSPGKPGDFDFLTGEWKIRHRKLKSAATGEWDEFDGEATCWSILQGVGHVEELRIPARDFNGMGLRLLDLESKVWSDYWVNAKSGVLGAAGLTGGFVDGEGIFEARDVENGKPVVYRGVWDRIVPGKSHRWYQAASRDDGKTWDISWTMDWRRA